MKFWVGSSVDPWIMANRRALKRSLCEICMGEIIAGYRCEECKAVFCDDCLQVYKGHGQRLPCCQSNRAERLETGLRAESILVPEYYKRKQLRIEDVETVVPIRYIKDVCENADCSNKLLPYPPTSKDGRKACGDRHSHSICRFLMNLESALEEGKEIVELSEIMKELVIERPSRSNPDTRTEENGSNGIFSWCWDCDYTSINANLEAENSGLSVNEDKSSEKYFSISYVPMKPGGKYIWTLKFSNVGLTCCIKLGVTTEKDLDRNDLARYLNPGVNLVLNERAKTIRCDDVVSICVDLDKREKAFIAVGSDKAKEVPVRIDKTRTYYPFIMFNGTLSCSIEEPMTIARSKFKEKYQDT